MTVPAVVNRKTIRKAIATALRTELGSKIQVLYDFQKKTLDKQSPVIVVDSAAADRVTQGINMLLTNSTLYFSIHIFVRYQDLDASPEWTEEKSEDCIDDLEAAISSWILRVGDNTSGDDATRAWLQLYTVGASDMTRALFDGIDYRHEEIPVAVDVGNAV